MNVILSMGLVPYWRMSVCCVLTVVRLNTATNTMSVKTALLLLEQEHSKGADFSQDGYWSKYTINSKI